MAGLSWPEPMAAILLELAFYGFCSVQRVDVGVEVQRT